MSNNKAIVHPNAHKHYGGFEVAISASDLAVKGGCHIFEGRSTAGHREVPEIEAPRREVPTNGIIQHDQPWYLEFYWVVYGPLACLLDCGYWQTTVIFEKMGGGETPFSPEAITQDVGTPGHKYESRVTIEPHNLTDGVYRVVACLQYCFEDGSPGPISGFLDKGLIKVYKDKRITKQSPAGNGVTTAEAVE